jgi:hypothetical protein
MERNRKLAEPSASGIKRLAMHEELRKTLVGKAVATRKSLEQSIESKKKHIETAKAREKAPKDSLDYKTTQGKVHKQMLEMYSAQLAEMTQKFADHEKEYPLAAEWTEQFKTMKLEQQLAFAKAYDKKNPQDPIVVAPKREAKVDFLANVSVRPLASVVDDSAWTSLEKVFLACYARDTPLLPRKIESEDLHNAYHKWATDCGFPKDMILGFNGYRTLSKEIKKADLLSQANQKKPIVWSLEKLKELPKAPDTYLGISTYPKKAYADAQQGRDPFVAAMDERMDKIDEYHEEQMAKAVSEMPVPRALRENGSSSGAERKQEAPKKAKDS